MVDSTELKRAFLERTGRPATGVTFAPGRVNLIGEHIDYHGGPVLPMALERGISIAWAPRDDGRVVATTGGGHTQVSFQIADPGPPVKDGDWGNYLRAAATADYPAEPSPALPPASSTGLSTSPASGPSIGVDMLVAADLPAASGLSSSSALVVAAGCTLLAASDQLGELTDTRRRDLATAFAEAERYVGTRGGGMDQAASVGGVSGHAVRITFDPLHWRPIPLPEELGVIVAHTGVRAEKSGAALSRYNAIREGFTLPEIAAHIESEKARVDAFVRLVESWDNHPDSAVALGRLVDESHASLRDRLNVSHPALEFLTRAAHEAGALGARLTGAGFGGSVVAIARKNDAEAIRDALRSAQASLPGALPAFVARAGGGAFVRG